MQKTIVAFFFVFLSFNFAESRDNKPWRPEQFTEIRGNRITNVQYRAIIVARKRLDELGVNADHFDVFVHAGDKQVELEFSYRTVRNTSAWNNGIKGCASRGRPVCKGFLIEIETMKILQEWDVKF
jgi:hypothetical protein